MLSGNVDLIDALFALSGIHTGVNVRLRLQSGRETLGSLGVDGWSLERRLVHLNIAEEREGTRGRDKRQSEK